MSKKFYRKYGPWAVVTGASSGIGAEFARQLAEKKFNLVLVARSEAKMRQLASELEAAHKINAKVLALDLSQDGFIKSLEETIQGLDIGLLISNAGADHMGAFLRVPVEKLQSMLRLNAESHMLLAHHFGERFLRQDRGGIVMVSSTASLQGTPYAGNYAGAKAYVLNLGIAMNYELKKTGVDVSVLVPGPTSTPAVHDRTDIDLNKVPAPLMKTKPVVSGALNALKRGKPYYIPGVINRVMSFMGRVVMGRTSSAAMWGFLMKSVAPSKLKI